MTQAPLQQALQTYLDHLSVERGLAANTLASYRRDLRRYLAHLATRDVAAPDEVTEPDVSAFLVALREGDEEHPALAPLKAWYEANVPAPETHNREAIRA